MTYNIFIVFIYNYIFLTFVYVHCALCSVSKLMSAFCVMVRWRRIGTRSVSSGFQILSKVIGTVVIEPKRNVACM